MFTRRRIVRSEVPFKGRSFRQAAVVVAGG
jgi:hypothetical protein